MLYKIGYQGIITKNIFETFYPKTEKPKRWIVQALSYCPDTQDWPDWPDIYIYIYSIKKREAKLMTSLVPIIGCKDYRLRLERITVFTIGLGLYACLDRTGLFCSSSAKA